MKRTWLVILGLLTIAPALCIFGWLIFAWEELAFFYNSIAAAGTISGVWIVQAGSLLGFVLTLFYLGWVIFASELTTVRKVIWVVALSIAGLVTMPVLWWIHFWRRPNAA